MTSISTQNQVVTQSTFREIFSSVINDMVCAKRSRRVHVPRAAHGSHLSAERFGNLHCEGMLAPIAPLPITGALWYQGEQNSERGFQYRRILPALIADWRKLFGQGDFPFYIVNLPTFRQRSATPFDDTWAETRESQALTAATVRNSCLAVTIDTGDPDNLHPKDKQPVGERLALCALANHYGKKLVYSGPTLASVEHPPGSIRLHFAHADGGLVVKGAKLEEFEIAGEGRKWNWADAHVEGDTVLSHRRRCPIPERSATHGSPILGQLCSTVRDYRPAHFVLTAGRA